MRNGIALALFAALLACSKDDNDKGAAGVEASSSGKLSAAELAAPTNLPKLSADAAKASLESISHGMGDDSDPIESPSEEGEGGSDEDDNAVGECIENLSKDVKVKASGDTLSVDYAVDFSSCLSATIAAEGITVTVTKAQIRFYLEASCQGSDFSALNGKTLTEVGSRPEEVCTTTETRLSNSSSRTAMAIKFGSETIQTDTENISSESTANNSACTLTISNGMRNNNGCVTITKSVDNVNPESNLYQKLTSKNVKWNNANPGLYYESGSFDVVVNDWTGAITYSGPTTPPSYSITNGTDTASGTIAQTAFSLVRNQVKAANQQVLRILRR